MDKLLYENTMLPKMNEGTETTDITTTIPKVGFSNSVASKTLPAVLGYVQPIDAPSGFVFAMKPGPAVNQDGLAPSLSDGAGGFAAGTALADDLQITRTLVDTGIREIIIDCTNEVSQDIQNLFGNDFDDNFRNFLYYDGAETGTKDDNNPHENKNDKLAKFFMQFATWKMSRKTNLEFVNWLSTVSTPKGTYDVANINDIGNIKGVVAELKDALYTQTEKTGRVWVLGSPKIINYLQMTETSWLPDNTATRTGKRVAKSEDYNYVFSSGEVDYYQDINIVDKIYCGISGGPGVSSVFYSPYKEYFIQGGEDYQTGQSNVFFRLRDAWVTNPLDNGTGVADSDYIVSGNITFSAPTLLI